MIDLTTSPGLLAHLAPALGAMNVVTWAVYRYDKSQARCRGRRVPEQTLLSLAALGGLVGAFIASAATGSATRRRNRPFLCPCISSPPAILAAARWYYGQTLCNVGVPMLPASLHTPPYPPIVELPIVAATPRSALHAQIRAGIAGWSAQIIGETLLQIATDLDDPADATLPAPLWLAIERYIYRVAEQRLRGAPGPLVLRIADDHAALELQLQHSGHLGRYAVTLRLHQTTSDAVRTRFVAHCPCEPIAVTCIDPERLMRVV